MRVLITNDDGIDSPGLGVLVDVATAAGHDVIVAAPARESSGASASLMGREDDGRLVVERRCPPGVADDVECFAVWAAPGLITFVAAYGGFGPKPDIVLSGVNKGANTGHAVLHSGTVGAALAATTHGIRSMAVSLNDPEPTHWETARLVTREAYEWLISSPRTDRTLNVNVPDVPPERLRGLRKAPLAAVGTVQGRVHEVAHGHLMLTYSDVAPASEQNTDAGMLARSWATVTLLEAPAFDADADLPEFDGSLR